MYICYIVGAGEVRETFTPDSTDYVIAADGGVGTLARMGITPNLIIGDFDSLGTVPEGENVKRLPVEKDETDTAAALRAGVVAGYTCFCIYGGTGGREDHTLANLQLLYHIAREGMVGFLAGNGFVRTVLVNKGMQIPSKPGKLLSVFSLAPVSKGVTIEGVKYPLTDGELSSDFPLGVSNESFGPATVKVKDGALLVMWEAE